MLGRRAEEGQGYRDDCVADGDVVEGHVLAHGEEYREGVGQVAVGEDLGLDDVVLGQHSEAGVQDRLAGVGKSREAACGGGVSARKACSRQWLSRVIQHLKAFGKARSQSRAAPRYVCVAYLLSLCLLFV